MNPRNLILGAAGAAVLIGAGWYLVAPRSAGPQQSSASDVRVPDLPPEEQAGAALFAENCATCHGENATGTDKGPPFINRIYEPNHHGDMAFLMAAQNGVRAHHWEFGNMPPVQGVTPDDVTKIVAYVRALQRANGIE